MTRIVLVYGLLSGLIIVGVIVVGMVLSGGQHTHSSSVWLGYLVMLLGLSMIFLGEIAVLTFLYCLVVICITHFAADSMRASPRVTAWLNRIAGSLLVGFGVKLALGR